jgi:hypothetical protein
MTAASQLSNDVLYGRAVGTPTWDATERSPFGLGLDPDRLAIGGGSAGGGFPASPALPATGPAT